jgi:hypothetical protein
MGVAELRRLKQLEDENRRLKQLVADLTLGKPTDNAFAESFNGRLRDECLSAHWFETLSEAKSELETWRKEYNTERPHSSSGLKTPAEFAARWRLSEQANPVRHSSTGPDKRGGSIWARLKNRLVHKMGAGHRYRPRRIELRFVSRPSFPIRVSASHRMEWSSFTSSSTRGAGGTA